MPRGLQPESMHDSMEDLTTADALYVFSDKLERALRRHKYVIVR